MNKTIANGKEKSYDLQLFDNDNEDDDDDEYLDDWLYYRL